MPAPLPRGVAETTPRARPDKTSPETPAVGCVRVACETRGGRRAGGAWVVRTPGEGCGAFDRRRAPAVPSQSLRRGRHPIVPRLMHRVRRADRRETRARPAPPAGAAKDVATERRGATAALKAGRESRFFASLLQVRPARRA